MKTNMHSWNNLDKLEQEYKISFTNKLVLGIIFITILFIIGYLNYQENKLSYNDEKLSVGEYLNLQYYIRQEKKKTEAYMKQFDFLTK